jgi:hypothetical protein
LEYVQVSQFFRAFTIPKFSRQIECNINSKILAADSKLESFYGPHSDYAIYYRAAGGGYFLLIKNQKSLTYINGQLEDVKAEKSIAIREDIDKNIVGAIISSSLYYWNYIGYTDCRNLTKTTIDNFHCPKSCLNDNNLAQVGKDLFSDYEKNSYRKDTYYKTTNRNVVYWEYYPKLSKPIIDSIDSVLAKHYGFTEEELDFIINYDIKYRMGDELNTEE